MGGLVWSGGDWRCGLGGRAFSQKCPNPADGSSHGNLCRSQRSLRQRGPWNQRARPAFLGVCPWMVRTHQGGAPGKILAPISGLPFRAHGGGRGISRTDGPGLWALGTLAEGSPRVRGRLCRNRPHGVGPGLGRCPPHLGCHRFESLGIVARPLDAEAIRPPLEFGPSPGLNLGQFVAW